MGIPPQQRCHDIEIVVAVPVSHTLIARIFTEGAIHMLAIAISLDLAEHVAQVQHIRGCWRSQVIPR